VLVLHAGGEAQQAHALAQALQQGRQLLDHAGAVVAVGFGAGRPQQVGGHLFERTGFLMSQTVLDAGHRQHIDPDLEEEVAHLVTHRHFVEQLAQLDRVLNRQGFLLLDLLCHAHESAGAALFAQVGREEFLELVEHQLEDTPAGLGVLLDHLHHALDLGLQGGRTDVGLKAHHARPHAVDQATGRVLQGTEKLGLCQCHAQHRNLQPGKPHPHARRDAFLGQNALKHEGHHLDGGFLRGGAGGLFEFGRALAQNHRRLFHVRGIHVDGTWAAVA